MGSKTASNREKKEPTQEFEESCAHHWIIETPNGPVSTGTCKKCGATKEFNNWGVIDNK